MMNNGIPIMDDKMQKEQRYKKQTNVEYIRQFSIEEMAWWIATKYDESCPPGKKWNRKECGSALNMQCCGCWMTWLNQEADRDKWEEVFEDYPE